MQIGFRDLCELQYAAGDFPLGQDHVIVDCETLHLRADCFAAAAALVPRMTGRGTWGHSPLITCQSEWQTPLACNLIRTSP